MGHSVVIEIGRCRESFAAHGTLVRLLSAVDPPVSVERAGRGESLAADVADVRFLARVRPDVPLQQRRPVEGFAAHLARQQGSLAVPFDGWTSVLIIDDYLVIGGGLGTIPPRLFFLAHRRFATQIQRQFFCASFQKIKCRLSIVNLLKSYYQTKKRLGRYWPPLESRNKSQTLCGWGLGANWPISEMR